MEWMRDRVGVKLPIVILLILLLSVGYISYMTQWLSLEFESFIEGIGAEGAQNADLLKAVQERVTLHFISVTLIFLAITVIAATVFLNRFFPEPGKLMRPKDLGIDAESLMDDEDFDEDLDEDPDEDLSEDFADDEKDFYGRGETALPAELISANENSGILAHSYSKMLEALQKINDLEKEHSIELAQANEQLQREITERKRAEREIRYLSSRLISGIEEARKHLAQDLHDEFGQTLTALHIETESLVKAMPDALGEQRMRIDCIVRLIEQLGDKIRSISSDLRPDLLDDLGLVPTLEWYITEFKEQREDIRVEFRSIGLRKRFSSEIELVLYRIFQEALTNMVKHSQADRFEVTLTYSHPKVIFILRDNGIGFDQEKKTDGIGLLGMRERVVSVNGSIAIISGRGKGTTIRVELPVALPPTAKQQEE